MDTLWRFIFNSAGKVAMSSVTHCIQKERFSHTPPNYTFYVESEITDSEKYPSQYTLQRAQNASRLPARSQPRKVTGIATRNQRHPEDKMCK